MIRKLLLAACATVLIVAGLGAYIALPEPTFAAESAMLLPVDPVPLVAQTDSGDKSFTIEVADDASERSKGLMYRKTMEDDHGMLFVFEQTQPVGFWMKNTPMPLDLLFIGQDGRVKDIKPGKPFSEASISPNQPVRFVLEFKSGIAGKAGIKAGDLLKHPVINAAPGMGSPG